MINGNRRKRVVKRMLRGAKKRLVIVAIMSILSLMVVNRYWEYTKVELQDSNNIVSSLIGDVKAYKLIYGTDTSLIGVRHRIVSVDGEEEYKIDYDGSKISVINEASVDASNIDKEILGYIEEVEEVYDNIPPKYFIYGTMLVEAGVVDSGSLYDGEDASIYSDLMVDTGGISQYSNGDIYNGEIVGDRSVMIGPFQISSAYYKEWVELAGDSLIEGAGGDIPEGITNRGDSGQPLYLPDVILGKLLRCRESIDDADRYMSTHYEDWEEQSDVIKSMFGVMWYNIEYHGGSSGIQHAKDNPIIFDYYYDIVKEVYKDNNYLDVIDNWSQASDYDNKCVEEVCKLVDSDGSKGYMDGYKEYAGEGDDTYLGDWVYAVKCLHFGLKRLEGVY